MWSLVKRLSEEWGEQFKQYFGLEYKQFVHVDDDRGLWNLGG